MNRIQGDNRDMDTSHWKLRVTSTESGATRVSMRRHQFTVGKPVDFDMEASHVSALEYVLGALAAEIVGGGRGWGGGPRAAEVVGGLRVFAKRRRIEIDHVEAVVDGQLEHAMAYLEVVGESGRPRLSGVSIKVYVASPQGETVVRRLWAETLERLPLVRTLGRALDLQIELALTG